MINYHLADLVSRLNNSTSNSLIVPITRDNSQFLNVLVDLGVIKEVSPGKSGNELLIAKNSSKDSPSNLPIPKKGGAQIKLISKPGKRIYISHKDLVGSTYIVRTSQGILPSHTALKLKLGGELLAKLV